ncbi:MAG: DNA translocase FtsK 4TM domain-containing protein [Candidatus Pacebacteria bacterium]|nr:DNA translocase FtsK 4TM domain-containing protein [Candidatus Paceibacterota bacterium]
MKKKKKTKIIAVKTAKSSRKLQREKVTKRDFPLINISLSEKTKRYLWSSLSFLFGLILLFSFFDMSGQVGKVIKDIFKFFVGNVFYIVPIIFFFLGYIFLKDDESYFENKKVLVIADITFLLSAMGLFGLYDFSRDPSMRDSFVWNSSGSGGWIGYLLSWPILKGFDFWVSFAIFFLVFCISSIVIGNPLFKKWMELRARYEDEYEDEDEEETKEKKPVITSLKDISKTTKEKLVGGFEALKRKEDFNSVSATEKKAGKAFEERKLENEEYKYPPIELLSKKTSIAEGGDIAYNSAIIKKTLYDFQIPVEMDEVNIGPTVTQYTLKPAEGIRLSKITALQQDLALALASQTIRIEAPIPGRSLVGIEVPNKKRATIGLREVFDVPEFQQSPVSLLMSLGKDVRGIPAFADLSEMPHMLVGGTTGSGKTICLNTIILSLLFRNSPKEMKMILIDPKRVEFPVYTNLGHLLCPVIYDAQQTLVSLKWLVGEMERRFIVLAESKSRDIGSYNSKMEKKGEEKMPFIVLIIDELADLMSTKGKEIESYIVRLAQMSRATGIHLILATQRPSVEVLTGLIKANIPTRIALKVGSLIDSRTILDSSGAEKLLGKGDMLLLSKEYSKPRRIQNPYISELELKKVITWITDNNNMTGPSTETQEEREEGYIHVGTEEENSLASELTRVMETPEAQMDSFYAKEDPLYEEAKRMIIASRKASTSMLQRRLGVGYARAARLIDILEERGVVGPPDGAKPREVLMKDEEGDE